VHDCYPEVAAAFDVQGLVFYRAIMGGSSTAWHGDLSRLTNGGQEAARTCSRRRQEPIKTAWPSLLLDSERAAWNGALATLCRFAGVNDTHALPFALALSIIFLSRSPIGSQSQVYLPISRTIP